MLLVWKMVCWSLQRASHGWYRWAPQAWDLLGQVIVALEAVNWLRCCPTANCKASSPVFLVKVEWQTVLWPVGVCNAIAYLPESAVSHLELQVSQNIKFSLLTKQSMNQKCCWSPVQGSTEVGI